MKTFIFYLALGLSLTMPAHADTMEIASTSNAGEILREGDCEIVPNAPKKLFPNPQTSYDPYTIVYKHPQEQVDKHYNCIPFKSKKKALTYADRGKSSWYGNEFHKQKAASGITFHENVWWFVAHKTLVMGTIAKVTPIMEGAEPYCVIAMDRGPYHDDRILDMAKALAEKMGMIGSGLIDVDIEAVGYMDLRPYRKSGEIPPQPKNC